jgi:hypothetical protein
MVAWSTQPGFYDGFAPPQPYRWVSPPPQSAGFPTQSPAVAHEAVTTQPGVQQVGVGTSDRQAQLLFQPGTFASAPVVVDVRPSRSFPPVSGFEPSTNVYVISTSVPLARPATVRLLFSDVSRTGKLYRANFPSGPWVAIGSPDPQGLPYFQGPTSALPAYFVGGSPVSASSKGASSSGLPLLQLVLAGAVALILVGALPLVLLRRRGSRPAGPDQDWTD